MSGVRTVMVLVIMLVRLEAACTIRMMGTHGGGIGVMVM
tara:strand:+ start:10954 stop:11070 length:117 start_codon:yes stop_codon:yes gene_type:complete